MSCDNVTLASVLSWYSLFPRGYQSVFTVLCWSSSSSSRRPPFSTGLSSAVCTRIIGSVLTPSRLSGRIEFNSEPLVASELPFLRPGTPLLTSASSALMPDWTSATWHLQKAQMTFGKAYNTIAFDYDTTTISGGSTLGPGGTGPKSCPAPPNFWTQ